MRLSNHVSVVNYMHNICRRYPGARWNFVLRNYTLIIFIYIRTIINLMHAIIVKNYTIRV
jgi:hypothetical protein